MTNLLLVLVGLSGILAANLLAIDELNQTNEGSTNLKQYSQRNWANIALSIIIVLVSILAKSFILKLEAAGFSLFIGIFAIGMVGPTVARFIRAKAKNFFRTLQS
jgi:hypothetical protein